MPTLTKIIKGVSDATRQQLTMGKVHDDTLHALLESCNRFLNDRLNQAGDNPQFAFDARGFVVALRLHLQMKNQSLRAVAEEVDISFSTISRIVKSEELVQPEIGTFIKLCNWMGSNPALYFDIFYREPLDDRTNIPNTSDTPGDIPPLD